MGMAVSPWCVGLLCLLLGASAWADLDPFPLQDVVDSAFSYASQLPKPTPSGVKKHSYLELISGTVEYFVQFQNINAKSPQYGRIIDPYASMEIQYSTPCFANAAARLVKEGFYNQTYSECAYLSRTNARSL